MPTSDLVNIKLHKWKKILP